MKTILKITNIVILSVLVITFGLLVIPKKVPISLVKNDLVNFSNYSFHSDIDYINNSDDLRVEFVKEIARYPNNTPTLLSRTKTIINKTGKDDNLKLYYCFITYNTDGYVFDVSYQRYFIEDKKYYVFDSKTNTKKTLSSTVWKSEFVTRYLMGLPCDEENNFKLFYSDFLTQDITKATHHGININTFSKYYDYTLNLKYNMFSKDIKHFELREDTYNDIYLSETTSMFYVFD